VVTDYRCRFLFLSGLDLEEHLERRAALAAQVSASTRPRRDIAALADTYLDS
jgi:hypothetical protein